MSQRANDEIMRHLHIFQFDNELQSGKMYVGNEIYWKKSFLNWFAKVSGETRLVRLIVAFL